MEQRSKTDTQEISARLQVWWVQIEDRGGDNGSQPFVKDLEREAKSLR